MYTKKIKTGICSYGMSGKLFHAPFIDSHPGYELTAITERTKEESRERYPHSKLYRSVEEMIADDGIELIIVNTPVQTHFDYASKAIHAGKHVIVEKPFTVTVAEAEELVRLSKEKNVKLIVYQNRRYDGDYRSVKEVLDNNLIGAIKEAEIRFDRYRPAISPKLHKETALPGAGITYDLTPHLIDQALQFFGWPQAVFADMLAMRDGSPVDDYVEILLYYPTFRVRLKASCFVKKPVPEYIFHGTVGTYLQIRSDRQEEELLKGVVPTTEPWCSTSEKPDAWLYTIENGIDKAEERIVPAGNYMGYFEDVYHYIVNDAPNPVPGEDGVKVMRIIEAAKQSAAKGGLVSV